MLSLTLLKPRLKMKAHKLIMYHSVMASPDYIHGHIGVAYKLTRKEINTYEEYLANV